MDPAEGCPRRSPRDIFARYGYAPLPPNELDDRQLPGRLWELLYAAAACRLFFCATDLRIRRVMASGGGGAVVEFRAQP
ncbi:MAG: hypothetical protein ACLQVX_20175 [Limisphaerales bacterium]